MYNRKTHLTPITNEGYESDVDVINDGRRLSAEINNILSMGGGSSSDASISDLGLQISDRSSVVTPPTRNPMSHDNLVKTQLSKIPEEVRRMDSKYSENADGDENQLTIGKDDLALGLQNMSLSNFKMVQGKNFDVSNHPNDAINRNDSSVIEMKDITDTGIQKGRNYRKVSTFMITPKEHHVSFGVDNRLNIKLVDTTNVPNIFIQLDGVKISPATNHYYWMELSRWLKFEEDYNCDSEHFNYAHLSPLSIRGMTNFKSLFKKGEVILDCHAEVFSDVLDIISQSFSESKTFSEGELMEIRKVLGVRHFKAGESVPFGEIPMYHYDQETQRFQPHVDVPMSHKRNVPSFAKLDGFHRIMSRARLDGKLEPNTECLSIQVAALGGLEHTFSLFLRLDPPCQVDDINEVSNPLRFLFVVIGPKTKEEELNEVGRVLGSMMSNNEFREVGYSAHSKEELLEATNLYVSQSVLVCPNKIMTHDTLAAMLPQLKGYYQRFMAEKNQKLFDDMRNEMLKRDHEITLNGVEGNGQPRKISLAATNFVNEGFSNIAEMDEKSGDLNTITTSKEVKGSKAKRVIMQFCPPMRYFIHDWRGYGKRFKSDFKDAFTKEHAPIVFVGFIFLYFVVLTPAITFGALLNAVNPKMTITMMLLASGFFQLFNTLFGGQPFEVVGITGPIFAAEKTLGVLAVVLAIDLGCMRLWIGVYIALLGIVFTILNGVVIVKHLRRSVEEIYNFLVCAIYAMSALFNMFIPLQYSPVTVPFANGSNINIIVAERQKVGVGGTTLFLAFMMLSICMTLLGIKKGTFFRRKARKLLGSLNVPLGIVIIIILANVFFVPINLPTLNVPPSNQVNFSLWFNIPSMTDVLNVSAQAHGFCFLIAISIFSTMTCEVACNGIMTSKADRRLLKPTLFSLNFFNTHVIFPLISGFLGWPFISGGTVRSHIHCVAMSKWSLRLPGVPAKIIGAAEQRISGSLVGLLVLLSVFFGSALRLIPMAALYGMFLYMAIVGMIDLVFIRRFINIHRRRKYWKAHDFLKDYPTWNILILVFTQLFFVGILVILNCIQQFTTYAWTPLLYAPTIGLYAMVRAYILPRWRRLNTHLSKMDKKHPVKLYADLKCLETVIVTVDESGLNMQVVQKNETETTADPYENDSDADEKVRIEKDQI